jgi:hypothetical protein
LPLGNLFIATGRPKVTAVASARGAALGWVVHVTTDPGDYDGLPLLSGEVGPVEFTTASLTAPTISTR